MIFLGRMGGVWGWRKSCFPGDSMVHGKLEMRNPLSGGFNSARLLEMFCLESGGPPPARRRRRFWFLKPAVSRGFLVGGVGSPRGALPAAPVSAHWGAGQCACGGLWRLVEDPGETWRIRPFYLVKVKVGFVIKGLA